MAKETAVKRKIRLEKMRRRYYEKKDKESSEAKQFEENVSKINLRTTRKEEKSKDQGLNQTKRPRTKRSLERQTTEIIHMFPNQEENAQESNLKKNESHQPFQVHIDNIVECYCERNQEVHALVNRKRLTYLKQLENETPEQYRTRLENMRQRYIKLSPEDRKRRSEKAHRRYLERKKNETPDQYKTRLESMRQRYIKHRENESLEARAMRSEKAHKRYMERIRNETPEQYKARLEGMRQRYIKHRSSESHEERKQRLEKHHEKYLDRLKNETPEQYRARLESMRQRYLKYRRMKTSQERKNFLESFQIQQRKLKPESDGSEALNKNSVNKISTSRR